MFQGVTAFLEAIDERAEQHAWRQQAAEEASAAEALHDDETVAFGGRRELDAEEVHSPLAAAAAAKRAEGRNVPLPEFPAQPAAFRNRRASSHLKSGAMVDGVGPSQTLSHYTLEGEEATTAAASMGGGGSALVVEHDAESAQLKRRDEEIDTLTRDVRRHQAASEAARQDLLQRSLQVHQLEEALREVNERFNEHKAKSRCLLEEKQREYEALRHRLERVQADGDPGAEDVVKGTDKDDVAAARQRVEELEAAIASMGAERERLQAQVAASRREVAGAHEQRLALVQQMDFLRLDLRGAQEALDSEVVAHQRSKAQLQARQRELNELRAAVEKCGGTFTVAGALVTLRSDDGDSRDQLLMSRQLLEKQNMLEAALRDAAEWRRRCERATYRLEEERTTRVAVSSSSASQITRDSAEFRPALLLRRGVSANKAALCVLELVAAVDATTLRIGRLLRRKPVLRVAVAFYIVCLHGWIGMMMMMVPRAVEHAHAAAESP
ncbi:hypothetical protein DQ04_09411020 [Trypanosoma grayi]|uniref:hypothetical protein n=1 Tax=Trypanosoma grayi TaxID=71804 RepID=UPI0004F43EDC|nr:hypothetical protein DQ04_09411020 [Trypanosoma grayi]KEG07568.1 hypothetical protein DQ04_09411020 [Trypanosoma grayi]